MFASKILIIYRPDCENFPYRVGEKGALEYYRGFKTLEEAVVYLKEIKNNFKRVKHANKGV